MDLEEKTGESKRTAIVMGRRAAFGLVWAVTMVVVFAAGWFGGQLDWSGVRPVAQASVEPESPAIVVVAPMPEPASPSESEEVSLDPTPPAPPQPRLVAPPRVAPEVASIPDPPDVLPEVESIAPITEGFGRAVAAADAGEFRPARSEAEALINDHGDYSGLVAAFRESGSDEVRARLEALRVLQLGGLDSVSKEVARELKRSYAGTAQVLESIHEWRILKPRVATLEPAIRDGAGIVVRGVIENPDVGVVRRVTVEVEALDAAGNVLAKRTSRVRPRSLDPGAEGSFIARFADLNPDSVMRARATVVEWESEVFDGG